MRRRHEDSEDAGPARGDHVRPCISHQDGAVAVGISQGEIQKIRRRLERRSVKARRDEYVVNRDLAAATRVACQASLPTTNLCAGRSDS